MHPPHPLHHPHGGQYASRLQLSPLSADIDLDYDSEAWLAGAGPHPHHDECFFEAGTSSRDINMFSFSNGQSRYPPVNTPSPPTTNSKATPHVWIQRSQVTSSKALSHLVVEFSSGGVKSFFCGWTGCKHPVGFAQKPQLITHIRSAHLQEKPFLCTTCNTPFARKQEASRHVVSLNSGRKYKCSGCHQAFSRKNYRDAHEECCMCEESTRRTRTQRSLELPDLAARPPAHQGSS